MSAPGNASGEIETRRRAVAFAGSLIAVLGLLVIGYPLTSATIKTLLLGWILTVVALTRFALRRHFQTEDLPRPSGRRNPRALDGLRMLPVAVDRQEMSLRRRRNHG